MLLRLNYYYLFLFWCFTNFPGHDSYLLFANTQHINRITLNGSHYEIVYSQEDTNGIVGLDYHYR